MATAPQPLTGQRPELELAPGQLRRRQTGHLKLVPETKELRRHLSGRAREATAALDKTLPFGQVQLEALATELLGEADLPEGYLGWTMVALASAFWHDQVAAVPFNRRLLLLPPSLEGSSLHRLAESLGYQVLLATGSPAVLNVIVGGQVDAILGVATLDVLEKAIDKILLSGIPCMAVPLLTPDDQQPTLDDDWAEAMIRSEAAEPPITTRSYVHLMRAAKGLFEPSELQRLAPRLRSGPSLAELNGQGLTGLDPVASTETIAYDFLAKGGKHSRPFITLAAYDAMQGGPGTTEHGAEHLARLPLAVLRTALSIETFHKASLVHDDIEDDDAFRYGEATLHRRYGVPLAINVGDYMIGLGYRLVSRDAASLGHDIAADILDRLADAHMKLSEGQGAELVWRDARDKRLSSAEAIKIYALKTAPAFEAALYAGLRLAGPLPTEDDGFVGEFARHLGVAFQILNDLGDWQGDDHNKLLSGGDVLGGRPTVLWALALEGLEAAEREELLALASSTSEPGKTADQANLAETAGVSRSAESATESALAKVRRVRELYQQAGVFDKAQQLVATHQAQAVAVAASAPGDELQRLLSYLVDTVLHRHDVPS